MLLEWVFVGSPAYSDSNGVSIHYELEGAGAPLVLQHGFTDSLQTWYDLGYVNVLKSDYQLILVDAARSWRKR